MGFAFVNRLCPYCLGEGCEECDGFGMRGSYEEVPDVPQDRPTVLGMQLFVTRLKRQVGFKQVAQMLGCTPSHVSAIERGREAATRSEVAILSRWFQEEDDNDEKNIPQ